MAFNLLLSFPFNSDDKLFTVGMKVEIVGLLCMDSLFSPVNNLLDVFSLTIVVELLPQFNLL